MKGRQGRLQPYAAPMQPEQPRVEQLRVPDAWVVTPVVRRDVRGLFLEQQRAATLAGVVGHELRVQQVNVSVSARGVLRGVHFADVGAGQAKYVWCARGAVLDIVVDVRTGSPTYAASDAVRLDDVGHQAVYLSEGLGHAFLALTDDAAVTYLCSEPYTPTAEHTVSPLDPVLALPWPADLAPLLSERDAAAPSLDEAQRGGLLPSYDACLARYAALRERAGGHGQ